MNINRLPKDPVLYSFCIYDLHDLDKAKIPHLKTVLDLKLKAKEYIIDMPKFYNYLQTTEMIARTMLNYIETTVYYQKKFAIINGSKEWKTLDEIRLAQIQERQSS